VKKAIAIAFLFCCLYSGAQDEKPPRLNVIAGYSAGFLFFKLNGIEESTEGYLKENMDFKGFYSRGNFKPTFLNRIYASASIFKNKSLFLELDAHWGGNKVTSYGYTSDALGNPMEYTSTADINLTYVSYGLRKEINLGTCGTLMPGLNFYTHWNNKGVAKVAYKVLDKSTGEVIKAGGGNGGSVGYGFRGSRILSFFLNPRLSIDYHVKIINHVYFNLSYSYWFLDGVPEDLYGLSNKWLIKFRNSNRIPAGRNRNLAFDLYSHNISVGLCFKLRK
jgi:hypothetical protein